MSQCLEDNAVLELFANAASPADFAQAEQHLDECRDCRELVATLAASSVAESEESPESDEQTELAWQATSGAELVSAGSRIGRYEIIKPIGSGVSSVVYAAYDSKLDRRIALKLLRVLNDGDEEGSPTATAKRARTRLIREAKALARVNHPNVVSIHDANVHGEYVYVAMEIVDGDSLREWLTNSTASTEQRVELMIRAARGLAAAHRAGIVHRDFKPANIMVGTDGQVKVTDFGLAQVGHEHAIPDDREASIDLPSTVTQTGAQVGTPAYMSPEVRRREPATVHSDQYSFGVTLCEVLTGLRPNGQTDVELSGLAKEFDNHHLLQRTIAKALSPVAADRFTSMDTLLEKLETRPRQPRRLRRVVIASAIALLAGGVAVGLVARDRTVACDGEPERWRATWSTSHSTELSKSYEADSRLHVVPTVARITADLNRRGEQWVAARRSVCKATHKSGSQSQALLDVRMRCLGENLRDTAAVVAVLGSGSDKVLDESLSILGKLPQPKDCATATSRVKPLPTGIDARKTIEEVRGRISKANALHAASQIEAAKEASDGLVEAARATRRDEVVADALFVDAKILTVRRDDERAEKLLIEAATLAASAGDDGLLASIHILLIRVVGSNQRRLEEALVWARAAEADTAALDDERLDLVAGRLREIGDVYLYAGKFEEGLELVEQALAVEIKARGNEHINVAQHLSRLGAAETRLGRFDKAATRLQEALAILEKVVGLDHPELGRPTGNLATVRRLQGKYDEAVALAERSLSLFEGAYGREHPHVATALVNLGHVNVRLEHYDKARAAYRRAMEVEAKLGDKLDDRSRLLSSLAGVDILENKFKDAVELLEQAVEAGAKSLKPDHPRMGSIRFNMGVALVGAGRADEALEAFGEARTIWAKALGPDNWRAMQPLGQIGEIERSRGQCEKAMPRYRSVIKVYEKSAAASSQRTLYVVALGICLAESNRHREAIEQFERGIELRRLEHDSAVAMAEFRVHLATSLRAIGENDQARKVIDLALQGLSERTADKPIDGLDGPLLESEAAKLESRARALKRRLKKRGYIPPP